MLHHGVILIQKCFSSLIIALRISSVSLTDIHTQTHTHTHTLEATQISKRCQLLPVVGGNVLQSNQLEYSDYLSVAMIKVTH